jgi:hypothetical protein
MNVVDGSVSLLLGEETGYVTFSGGGIKKAKVLGA